MNQVLKDIHDAHDVMALQTLSRQVPALHIQLTQAGANAATLGRSVTAITTAITQRLIQLAVDQNGLPPVPFAWLVAGSQAREEQTSHTDQDTALIVDNAMQPKHDEWFLALAHFVSDGLNRCGYIYCPGDVMATNPQWRQTQLGWREHFHQWIQQPRKRSLMYSSIFFDLRAIDGQTTLWNELHHEVLQQTQGNSLFIARLAAIALHHKPPLGLFNRFKTESGEHADRIDIKHGGIIPVVDMARLFALESGVEAVNTRDRLQQVAGSESLSETGASDLLMAFDFISDLRAQHQMKQLLAGGMADNYVKPSQLSTSNYEQLKNCFKIIRSMQKTLASRLGDGLLDE